MICSYMYEGQVSEAEEVYQWIERGRVTEFLIQRSFIRQYGGNFENDAATYGALR